MVTKITCVLLHRNNVSNPTRDTEVTRPCRSPLSFPCPKTQLPRLALPLNTALLLSGSAPRQKVEGACSDLTIEHPLHANCAAASSFLSFQLLFVCLKSQPPFSLLILIRFIFLFISHHHHLSPITMFLTETSIFPSFFDPFNNTKNKKDAAHMKFDLFSHSFDESLLRRLKTLTNSSSSSPPSVAINLSWLSSALDFLSSTHDEAINLLSSLKLDNSLDIYLDNSAKLLDLCNSISSEIERFRHRRLVLSFALHVLNDGSEDQEKLTRARVSLSDWVNNYKGPIFDSNNNLENLARDLALRLKEVPRGKISADERLVRRTIHAVGLVTVFVAGVVITALRGSTGLVVAVRAPPEFLWADSFNFLNTMISNRPDKKRYLLNELDEMEARIKEVSGVMVDGSGENGERSSSAVKELEMVTERLGEGLDRLGNGVNEIFNSVLSTRRGMLEKMSGSTTRETKRC